MKDKNQSSQYVPPKHNADLISKTTQLACNLVGFPCATTIFKDPQTGKDFYRIGPDLDIVEKNMILYFHLKDFNDWYHMVHIQKSGKPDNVTAFNELILALYDFGLHWKLYSAQQPEKSQDVVNLCRFINAKIAEDITKERTKN